MFSDEILGELLVPHVEGVSESEGRWRQSFSVLSLLVPQTDDCGLDGSQSILPFQTQEGVPAEQIRCGGWRLLSRTNFSEEYLRKMLKRSFWGEDVVLYALSCLFDLKITVVNGSTLDEHCFRHNQPLAAVDVVLVYNGHNQYIYAGRWTLVHLSGDSVGHCCITRRYYYVLYICH